MKTTSTQHFERSVCMSMETSYKSTYRGAFDYSQVLPVK